MSTVNSNSGQPDQAALNKSAAQEQRVNTDWARDGVNLPQMDKTAAEAKSRGLNKVVIPAKDEAERSPDEELARTDVREPGMQLAPVDKPELAGAGWGEVASNKAPANSVAESGGDRVAADWGREVPTHEFALPAFNSMYALAAGGLSMAAGIGGSGAAAASLGSSASVSAAQALKVVVYDGLIAGASIYVDRNGDGKVDASEKVGQTDAAGVAHVSGLTTSDLTKAFIAVGGTNVDTGLPNTMQLSAMSSSGGVLVLSPISSLVAALNSQGLTNAQAELAVKAAFGLPAGYVLSSYDPSLPATHPEALTCQKAGAQIATLGSDALLSTVALDKLASYMIAAPTTALDLSNVDTLKTIYGSDTATVFVLTDAAHANLAIQQASNPSEVVAAQLAGAAPIISGLLHDTGSSDSDKITNDPRLSVSGLNTGAHLQYSVDGGSTWVASDSFAPADGHVTVQARVIYDNGTVTASSNAFSFTLNSVTPAPVSLALHTDTGVAGLPTTSSDLVTSIATVDVGPQAAGSVLEFSSDQIHWSSGLPVAAEGANDIYARQSFPLTGATSPVSHLSFTLDTVAHVGSMGLASNVLGADVVNDTGTTGDGITSNSTPILSGQTEAHAASVTVTLDGHSYTVAAADISADGHWSLSVTHPLADGSYIPVVTVVDAAGNTSAATAMAAITVDTVAPEGSTAALAAASDTGFASDDGLTNQSHPTIEGTAEAHASVAVDIDGNVYRTTADAVGHWSVLVTTALADGDYTPSVTVTDVAGNQSDAIDGTPFSVHAMAPQEVTSEGLSQDDGISETVPFQGMDVVLAGDPGNFANDGITSNPVPLITGVVDEAGTVVIMRLDGVTYTTVADDAGVWSIQIPDDHSLTDGVYVPGLLYVDAAGNQTHLSGTPITIDTVAPSDLSGDLVHDAINDTGADSTDGITNNASPTVEGTTEAFAWVSVDIGGTVLDAVQADANGYWQVTAEGLSDGTYTPTITASDAAGNVIQADGGTFTITTVVPTDATAELVHDSANDTGVSQTDNITNNSSPTLEGHAEANAHVSVDLGGTVFETDADANGYWTLTADGLADGDYTPSITVSDLAGNTSDAVDGVPFTVVTVGPDAATGELVHNDVNDTGVDVTDNITANNMPELSGTAGAPNALVSIDFNGVVLTTTADDNGDWVLKVTEHLQDGDYVPVISVSDAAGNVTETEGTPFTIDTQAPTAGSVTAELVHDETNDTGIANDDGITSNSAPEISGTADPLALVHVDFVNCEGVLYAGFDTQADADGNWTQALDTPLDDGTYTPVITVIDLAGNVSEAINGVAFTVDTVAPAGATGGLVHDETNDTGVSQTDNITNNNAPTLEGHAEANAHVSVDLGGTVFETDADAHGYWSVTADGLADGDYTPSITVTDLAGNVSDAVDGVPFTVVTVALSTADGGLVHDSINDTGAAPDDGITNNNHPTLSGSADAGVMVSVVLGDYTYNTTADAQGVWTVQVTDALPDGEYTPLITASDVAGNVSDPVEGSLIVIKTVLGPVTGGITHDDVNDTGASTDDGITNNNLPSLSGTADAGASVLVTLDHVQYQTQADSDGLWTVQVEAALADGTYTPTLQVTDLAGNTSTTLGEALTIDTQAAFSGVGLPGNQMVHVGELTDFNPLANIVSHGEVLVEDYSGTLADGLSIDPTNGHIVGLPTATGMTYITLTSTDLAGNTAEAYFQFSVTALDKTANTSVNNIDPAQAASYLGTSAAEHINVYASANDVLLAGGGDDLFQMFKPAAMGFARVDGGAGVDQMNISGNDLVMDFSAFNNIDGTGQVLEHVESFNFAGARSNITITAADIFHLNSDIVDVDGKHSLVRIMSSANNGGSVTLDAPDVLGGLTQVGAKDAFGAMGAASSGSSADRYTKFTGSYHDGNGDHLVELLLQHGMTAA